MACYDPTAEALREELMRQLGGGRVTSTRPNQTQRVLPAFSGTYLVTFIGGPKNGMQEFLDSRAHSYIQDGGTWLVPMFEEANPLQGPQSSRNETFRYKTGFIPQNETSFTEDICIIALFQP